MNLKKLVLLTLSLGFLVTSSEAMDKNHEVHFAETVTYNDTPPDTSLEITEVMKACCSDDQDEQRMLTHMICEGRFTKRFMRGLSRLIEKGDEQASCFALKIKIESASIEDFVIVCKSLITHKFELLEVLKLIYKLKTKHNFETTHPEAYYDCYGYRSDEAMQELLDNDHYGPCKDCQTCKDLSFIFNQCKRVHCEIENAKNA